MIIFIVNLRLYYELVQTILNVDECFVKLFNPTPKTPIKLDQVKGHKRKSKSR